VPIRNGGFIRVNAGRGCTSLALEFIDILIGRGFMDAGLSQPLGTEDCRQLLVAALERGNADLALSIYRAMSSPALASTDSSGGSSGSIWPVADLSIVTTLVLGLARWDLCRSKPCATTSFWLGVVWPELLWPVRPQ
jgi:hypothetical protein